MLKILIAGDIVGSPGRRVFSRVVTQMKSRGEIDLAIANAENAAGGRGLTAAMAAELFSAGADALTLGDHAWNQKEMLTYIEQEPRVVRPANFAPGCPGKGWVTLDTTWGKVTVAVVVGRVFMGNADCPFRTMDKLLLGDGLGKVVVVDIHAEATSEKVVMGRYLDGRVSCAVGTHTHVQTSDERVLPGGTAYITDLGMTGPKDSALGRDLQSVTHMFLTGMPSQFKVARQEVVLEGVLASVDETTGRARAVKRLRIAE